MRAADIRESFLAFFESKGCRRLPSSSLVPDDPSLLLTTAGMVQFKPVFLGQEKRPYSRAATVQKCVRTTDIDIIGTTGRHHSFFEMLGNFSFGDYFKSEACAWAHEYSTSVLGLDPGRLWFSVYEDDDEAERVWIGEVGVPRERIVRMGAKDNFWSAGPTGPCGPCSELYYDQGPGVGCGSEDCRPGCDCDRYLEYWNLVFMQYDRQEDGSLVPLPARNIDTGMGLERIAAILQGVHSNFETDDLRAAVAVAEDVSGVAFRSSERTDVSLRILADHARAVTFLIADGVLPSNEGRGYVLRRLLRRAVRHGRLLGVTTPFMSALVETVIPQMGQAYPEIVEHQDLIGRIVEAEEQRFGATLRQGMSLLDSEVSRAGEARTGVLPGAVAFTLHDTYGFPVELTSEIAREAGLTVDMDAFEAEMAAQRRRGRAAVREEGWASGEAPYREIVSRAGEVEVRCHETDESSARVAGMVSEGRSVDRLEPGQAGEIVLDVTPFYAGQGGQVGDSGEISNDSALFEVSDTRLPVPGVPAHVGVLREGKLAVGDEVRVLVDARRRERIRRNHTATHLLHWALRLVLGEHVRQGGSYVAPDRLRFDFTHFGALDAEQTGRVERLVNAKIMENHPVRAYETSLRSAREAGVTALFGEKYGDYVRVIEAGNFSKELCGGTHAARTSEIGLLKILSESSVGANLRRIEAVTSFDALEVYESEEAVLERAAESLHCRLGEVAERAESLAGRLKDTEKALADARRRGGGEVDELLAKMVDVGYPLVIADVEASVPGDLRDLADTVRSRLPGSAVVLAAHADGGALLLAAGSDPAVAAGFDAGAVVGEMAPKVGGRGGGKPQMAQGGGQDAAGIPEALATARRMLGAE